MGSTKKMIRNAILFISLIILTFTIILKNANLMDIVNALRSVKMEYIIIAIVAMFLYFVCDAINIGRTLKALNEKSSFWRNLKYSLIGFFYSCITPAASGGQPMQVYYMHKDNIKVANSTLTLLINLTCMQVVTISLAIISLFFNYKYMNTALSWCFFIGISLNIIALTILLISIYSRRLSRWCIKFAIKIMKFFRIKNIEEKKAKFEYELQRYQDSAKYARQNRPLVIKTLLTTYLQFILFFSVSYWVYLSFGLSGHNIFEIVTMQSILFATVSGIPSPGAVGVSEGGYIALFGNIYAENFINTAMLIARGVSFYLYVLISLVIVMIYTIKDKKEEKLNKKYLNEVNEYFAENEENIDME